ncbi:DUF429 domain-containing protein [Nesterenkonia natronophila]|nr:DUF429 domain-containing protein [Nesterenkonia natronophila]
MMAGTHQGLVYAGVDLAAEPARTGLAVITGHSDQQELVIEEARLGVEDGAVVEMVIAADKTGVDVPLGWPQTFVEHVWAHSTGALTGLGTSDIAWRRSMAMRRTDLLVGERFGLRPLSVATDRIAYPALRWTVVEARLRERGIDCVRDGSGRVCEVYPAAALRWWGLPHRGYKSTTARAVREQIVEGLDAAFPQLDWNGFREECVVSDDVLDAVIAALVARETRAQRTWAPDTTDHDLALSEGWIHVPSERRKPGQSPNL